MTKFARSALVALAAALCAAPGMAAAQQQQAEVERIAALVNEEVVSYSDLMGRMRLALASSGLPDSPEVRQRLLPQVLRVLIDERLQIQEARRLELQVTDQMVDREISDIARRNEMNTATFQEALAQQGIPFNTLREQTRAGIAWSQIVQRRLRPTATVAEEEVANRLEQIKANVGKPEYLISEIFLSVDDPASEAEVRRLADRLVEQIGAGAPFAAVAQQFSQSASAAAGGNLDWVQLGQLEPDLDRALQQLKPGQFSRPIRGTGGYHIFWMRDQRTVIAGDPNDIKVAIGQFILPVPQGADAAPQFQQVSAVAEEASSCQALQNAADRLPGAQVAGLPLTRMGDIPQEIRALVQNLGVGTPTQPLVTDVGVMLLMICEREVPEGSTPPVDQVRNALMMERLDMLQRRYLRDLRREASIEYRL
ncbi:peptidylprolyl isomerase [Indioceanicola profundi]|uniref:peptidylprolyl isomerase n=1 Tax=Indioceanicola profundi TaxID=2220096 RepID=UPI0013C47386